MGTPAKYNFFCSDNLDLVALNSKRRSKQCIAADCPDNVSSFGRRSMTMFSKAFCVEHEELLVKHCVLIVDAFGLLCEFPSGCNEKVVSHAKGYFYFTRFCSPHKRVRLKKQLNRFPYPFEMMKSLMPSYDKKVASLLKTNNKFFILLTAS
jgi:hypothetical protein